jgi:nucleoredoxin
MTRFPRCSFAAAALFASLATLGAALPDEVTVTAPARFELMRGDKVGGAVMVATGEKLSLIDTAGDYVLVRYRNLNGRVLTDHTDLPRVEPVVAEAPPPETLPAGPGNPAAFEAPAPAVLPPHTPANAVELSLAGKLVRLDGGALQPFDGARLAGVKFYALYYSASWCAPCRQFTPGLVDAYEKIRALYPEFEVVLVNEDRSQGDMVSYMRDDKMTWPAVRWDAISGARDITRYCGDGIPCLVLIDENGKVLSDTNRWGRYVGPNTVLDDTWKILRDYRRKNPHPKA